MTADELIALRRADWTRLEQLLAKSAANGADLVELATLYRSASADTARARAAGSDAGTLAFLDGLLGRAHNLLYRSPPSKAHAVRNFLVEAFPRTLRRHRRAFVTASAAFYLPFFFGLFAAWLLPGYGAAVMGHDQLESFREMYRRAPDDGRSLGEGTQAVAYYIQHNTSIAFSVFASGIFAGLGSAFMSVYQGLVIGAVFGFLIGDAKGRNILTFTCGHSAWELTAICIAATAGIIMGFAIVDTRGRTRMASLRAARGDVVTLILGAACMLAVAAGIEGLWSPSALPAPVKWAFAVVQFGIVGSYLGLAGREVRQ